MKTQRARYARKVSLEDGERFRNVLFYAGTRQVEEKFTRYLVRVPVTCNCCCPLHVCVVTAVKNVPFGRSVRTRNTDEVYATRNTYILVLRTSTCRTC